MRRTPSVVHIHDDESSEHSVRITIEDDDRESESEGRKEIFHDGIQDQADEPGTSNAGQNEKQEETKVEKCSRTKTAGHSTAEN